MFDLSKNTMIATQFCAVGKYRFASLLPRIGHKDDQPQWSVHIDGVKLPALYATLEDAMRAAVAQH